MCTSFVYRKENVLIGMNFDNDGKDFKISTKLRNDFLVSVKVKNKYFPSIGINQNGVFVNDSLVDSNGEGKYKRQNDNRWVTTSLIQYIMGSDVGFEDVKEVLGNVEIVNSPNTSTHNLIADTNGNTCVVEPGRKNIFSDVNESEWCVVTNFPLSDYEETNPVAVLGSGSDRYQEVYRKFSKLQDPLTVEQGFEILESVKQDGPEWTTQISMIYDGKNRKLFYCLDQKLDEIIEYDFQQ
jgi:penicillin V acylase-like amidase (Ntn superfamily)